MGTLHKLPKFYGVNLLVTIIIKNSPSLQQFLNYEMFHMLENFTQIFLDSLDGSFVKKKLHCHET